MSDLKEAVAQIKRFAPMMQAVLDIADAGQTSGNSGMSVAHTYGTLPDLTSTPIGSYTFLTNRAGFMLGTVA